MQQSVNKIHTTRCVVGTPQEILINHTIIHTRSCVVGKPQQILRTHMRRRIQKRADETQHMT